MPLDLDPLEQRIVGVLIEKEATVPEAYPLTVNALVAGCNQKSNRDPHLEVQDYQVEGALKSLLLKAWVLELEKEGGRTRRYAHQADKQLGLGKGDLALLTELLVRGPQTPQELKTRCERMAPMGTADEVERRLRELAARPVPYVRLLERRSGERYARWMHLLGAPAAGAGPAPSAGPAGAGPSAPAPAAPTTASAPPGATPLPPRSAPPASAPSVEVERLRDLVETLEQRVLELEQRLDRLEGR